MIALVGNIIEDTVHIMKNFPKENQSNEVLLSYKQYGGIINVSRRLGLFGQKTDIFGTVGFDQTSINLKSSIPDYCDLHTSVSLETITANATIIVNKNKRSSLINWGPSKKITFNTKQKYIWCHIAYFDKIDNLHEIMPKIRKQCKYISIDFCGEIDEKHLCQMNKYNIDIIICSNDNNRNEYNLKNYCKYFAVEHTSDYISLNNEIVCRFKKSKNINVLGAGDCFAGCMIANLVDLYTYYQNDLYNDMLKDKKNISSIIANSHANTLRILKEQPYVN